MRKFFKELYNPCGVVDERLRESVERFVQEEAEAQRRYDDETGFGLKPQTAGPLGSRRRRHARDARPVRAVGEKGRDDFYAAVKSVPTPF